MVEDGAQRPRMALFRSAFTESQSFSLRTNRTSRQSQRMWSTKIDAPEDLRAAVVSTQVTPGPGFTTATFIAYLLQGGRGRWPLQ
jgi:hypothetical protein